MKPRPPTDVEIYVYHITLAKLYSIECSPHAYFIASGMNYFQW